MATVCLRGTEVKNHCGWGDGTLNQGWWTAGHLNTDVIQEEEHELHFEVLNGCGKYPEGRLTVMKKGGGKEWWIASFLMEEVLALKSFTFACSSIPGIAWLADAVVSSNSIEA